MRVMTWLSAAWLLIAAVGFGAPYVLMGVKPTAENVTAVYDAFRLAGACATAAVYSLPGVIVGWGVALALRGRRIVVLKVRAPGAPPPTADVHPPKPADYFQKGGRWLT